MPPMIHRHTLLLLSCLTLLAFGLRVLPLDTQSMWRDEIDTFCFALDFWDVVQQAAGYSRSSGANLSDPPSDEPSSPGRPHCQPTPGLSRVDPSGGLWSTLRTLLTLSGWNGPLYTIAMRPWIGLTGYSSFALRYSSLLLALVAVPLTYVLGRRILGTMVGLIGAMLVALSPHLVWYSQEAKMYAAILTLSLLAIYALRRALDQPCRVFEGLRSLSWWATTVIATTLAFYSHVLAALLIPLQVTLSLVWWPRTRRHWRSASIALAFLTLPYLPLAIWQVRSWLLPSGQATLFTNDRIDLMLDATFDGWGGHLVGEPWATLILAGLALLALFGLARAWLTKREIDTETGERDRHRTGWREPMALAAWISLPLVGIWLISVRQPIFTNRYLVWAAPAFYLLAASGFVGMVRLGRKGALVALGLLLLVVVGDGRALWHQATQPIKPDFKGAAAYLEQRYRPDDLIVFHLSYMADSFDYYYSGAYDSWGAPAPEGGLPENDLELLMRVNTKDHGTVWLVLSESRMWDPRGLIKAWMDAHTMIPPQEQIFAHVSVYRYELDR